MRDKILKEFKKELLDIYHLDRLSGLLDWDQNVNVPSGGQKARADMMSCVAALKHEKLTSKSFKKLLKTALLYTGTRGGFGKDDSFIVLRTAKDLKKIEKLPTKFVAELAQLCGESYDVWKTARERSDFKLFEPYLTKIVKAKREEAEFVGYDNSPYDALMDDYEEGLTCESVSEIFDELKAFLVPFIESIQNSNAQIRKDFLSRKFPIDKQMEFCKMVIQKLGFDLERGRIDTSVHPFCESTHMSDVRLTTRFKEDDFFNQALMSLIHEAGHGMYEQGLPEQHFGTPLGYSASMGIHESQSRLWENQVGRSFAFWNYFFRKLKETFLIRMEGVFVEDFYKALNYVEPGLIRVDADEVTYNLHVILRFEIEKDLIEGNMEVAELPRIWNQKMEEYFGLKVPNDAQGVLQDVHWSGGSFGYFPTYALGNLYAAQLFHAAGRQIHNLDLQIAEGNLSFLLEWLRNNIHVHGRRYEPAELIMKATGGEPKPVYFISYLEEKYKKIYNL